MSGFAVRQRTLKMDDDDDFFVFDEDMKKHEAEQAKHTVAFDPYSDDYEPGASRRRFEDDDDDDEDYNEGDKSRMVIPRYPRRTGTTSALSRSCPAKPLVGSLPTPELFEEMPSLSLPSTPQIDGEKLVSSLLTGLRVAKTSKTAFPRYSSQSCPSTFELHRLNSRPIPRKAENPVGIDIISESPISVSSASLSKSQTALGLMREASHEAKGRDEEGAPRPWTSPRVRSASAVKLPPSEPLEELRLM